MRISIIIAVYKDLEALKLIINSLRNQNHSDMEIVVAEDNDSNEFAEYIQSITDLDILHTQQEDNGILKAKSVNNAIIKSTGEYIIFIDGDCIPYSNFVINHAALSEPGKVLSGRRVNLGKSISASLRNKNHNAQAIEKYFLLYYFYLVFTDATHIEQGFSLSPDGWLFKNILSRRKKSNIKILGCNFSCFKDDLLLIDGFDEDYYETAVADDTDIQWRFENAGLSIKSCKLSANVFHLHHKFRERKPHEDAEIQKMESRSLTNVFKAEKGISTH